MAEFRYFYTLQQMAQGDQFNTAAEAVATGSESRIAAIGNPDRRGTEFHRIFTDPQLSQDWVLQTISAFDLPTFTGESVYEDELKQQNLLQSLTSVEWVEHKKREIVDAYLNASRIAIKSANGCGKSAVLSDLITWEVAVGDPAETLCIISAPTLSQIEKVIFAYLKVNKGAAAANGFEIPGRISETLTWKIDTEQGSNLLAFGKRPSDKDIVSSFQGTRKLRTKVFLDEAGGLPAEMFTAAEAVATGGDSKILAIGNPDRRGTEFHRIFTDPQLSQDWELHTISAFDLPTFTGEQVYPEPELQENLLRGLTRLS